MFALIATMQENMRDIEKVFATRFGKPTYSTHLKIRNGTRPKKDSARKRSRNLNLAFVQTSTAPVFDTESNFKITYSIQIYITENKIEIFNFISLLVTQETPLGDPWSVTIQSSTSTGMSIEEIEPKIAELLQRQLEHAKTFDSENPLVKTPYELVYPRIREMFTHSRWNEALESSSHYQAFPSEFRERFGSEVNVLRHEIYALGKPQQPKESQDD